MSQLNQFTEFPKFSAEIRIKIWRFAALTPRIVQFPRRSSTQEGRIRRRDYSFTCTGKVTYDPIESISNSNDGSVALLQVCQESRHETERMNLYRKMFGFSAKFGGNPLLSMLHAPRDSLQFDGIFFNPEIDVLLIDIHTVAVLAQHSCNDLAEAQYIAVYDKDYQLADYYGHLFVNNDPLILGRLWENLVQSNHQKRPKLKWIWLILKEDEKSVSEDPFSVSFALERKEWANEGLEKFIRETFGYYWVDGEGDLVWDEKYEDWQAYEMLELPQVQYLHDLKAEIGRL